jgi:hypothetical protein
MVDHPMCIKWTSIINTTTIATIQTTPTTIIITTIISTRLKRNTIASTLIGIDSLANKPMIRMAIGTQRRISTTSRHSNHMKIIKNNDSIYILYIFFDHQYSC